MAMAIGCFLGGGNDRNSAMPEADEAKDTGRTQESAAKSYRHFAIQTKCIFDVALPPLISVAALGVPAFSFRC